MWPVRIGVIQAAHAWSSYMLGDIVQNDKGFRYAKKIRKCSQNSSSPCEAGSNQWFQGFSEPGELRKSRVGDVGKERDPLLKMWKISLKLPLVPAGFQAVWVSCWGCGLASGLGGWGPTAAWMVYTVWKVRTMRTGRDWQTPSAGLRANMQEGCVSGPDSH